MSRTLADIFFTVRYICNQDSEQRARRYAHYFAKEHEKWLQVKDKYFPALTVRPRPDEARLTALATQFKSPIYWSGHSTREIAEEPDTVETAQGTGQPATYAFDYEVVYGWTSRYVHPTSSGVHSHIGAEGKAFRVARRELAGSDEGDCALFNTALYLSRIWIYLFRKLGAGLPPRVDRKVIPVLQFLKSEGAKHRRYRLRRVKRRE